MVVITFPDSETQKKALGFLLGRFSGKVLKNGEHIVLEALAGQNIMFTVLGIKCKSRRYEVLLRCGQINSFFDLAPTAKKPTIY